MSAAKGSNTYYQSAYSLDRARVEKVRGAISISMIQTHVCLGRTATSFRHGCVSIPEPKDGRLRVGQSGTVPRETLLIYTVVHS